MQQLFGVVNDLLMYDSQSMSRDLRVRSYKVIPLAPRAGIIEWVNNARSLTDCLVAPPNGAHLRCRIGGFRLGRGVWGVTSLPQRALCLVRVPPGTTVVIGRHSSAESVWMLQSQSRSPRSELRSTR